MISNRPYRSLLLKEYKEVVYRITGLRCASSPTTNIYSDGIAASTLYNAIPHVIKGAIIANPIKFEEFKRSDQPFLIQAHPAQDVFDFRFSPHAQNVLATVGKDEFIRVFELPKDGQITQNITVPAVQLDLNGKVPSTVMWHPTVRGLLAVGCREGIYLVNVDYDNFGELDELPTATKDGVILHYAVTAPAGSAGKDIVRISFNRDGSAISAIGKDGGFYVYDPRKVTDKEQLPSHATALGEMKNPISAPFIGLDQNFIIVVGLGRARRPTYQLFKIGDNYSLTSVCKGDFNISSGQLFVHYDYDTQLLLISARGARAIFVHDTTVITGDKPNATAFNPLIQLAIPNGTKGFSLLPKSLVNVMDAEILRFHSHAGDSIEVFGVGAIRREKGYHPELYPDTADFTPVLTLEKYEEGENAVPNTVSLSPYGSQPTQKSASTTGTIFGSDTTSTSSAVAPTEAITPTAATAASVTVAVKPAEARASATTGFNTAYRNTLDAKFQRSIFYHTSGVEPGANKSLYNAFDVKAPKKHLPYGRTLTTNSELYAMPLESIGGSLLFVRLLSTTGRVPTSVNTILGPSPITATALSELHRRTVATASEDGVVRVYRLPEDWTEGELPESIREPQFTFDQGMTGINFQTLAFHPYVEHVLVGVGYHSGMGCDAVCVFDTTPGTEEDKRCQIYKGLYEGRGCDIDFSPDGAHVTIGTKANTIVVIALPSGTVRFIIQHGNVQREVFARWYDRKHLVAVGNPGRGNERAVTVFSIDWTTLTAQTLGNSPFSSTYAMIPHLDPTTGLFFIAGVGTAQIRVYVINLDQNPCVTPLTTFASKNDVVAHAFMHKSVVDVHEVEVLRSIKLSQPNEIFTISWRIPRKRKEFFQDDLYAAGTPIPTTIAPSSVYFTSAIERAVMADPEQTEYAIQYKSLKPDNMVNLSEAPDEELTEREKKYIHMKLEKGIAPTTGFLGHKSKEEVDQYYAEKAQRIPVSSGRFDAQSKIDLNDVDDDEWD